MRRTDVTLPAADYRRYFLESVRGTEAIFHHGDLYPRAYDTVHAVTFTKTAAPVTIPDRLIPADQPYRLNSLAFWIFSEWPLGADIRSRLADPLLFRGEPVSWRNHEASYDTAELEPASRGDSTHALQEYFVPLGGFDAFVERLRGTLQRHRVNAINVSIRHALPDPGSLLAWARSEVFAFVLYYKQDTDRAARDAVGVWTRELIDAALEAGGSYYLPYQIHATEAQFLRAYPRASELFALKRRLDPTNKFSNALWERYYRASAP
jgi:FAD/FMN-containing dehydrogenase